MSSRQGLVPCGRVLQNLARSASNLLRVSFAILCAMTSRNDMSLTAVVAENVKTLVDLAKREGRPIHRLPRGFSLRTLAHARGATHSMTLRTLQKLAAAFGLEPWQLLLPDLPAELALDKRLAQTVRAYIGAAKDGQAAIETVANLVSKKSG